MLRVGATGIRGGSGWSTAGKDGGSRRLVANCTRVQGSVGLADHRPGALERLHEDQRCELSEVGGSAERSP